MSSTTTNYLSLFVPQAPRMRLEGLVFVLAMAIAVCVGLMCLHSFHFLKIMNILAFLGGNRQAMNELLNPSVEWFDSHGFTRSSITPSGYPEAIVYQVGNLDCGLKPIVVTLTDEFGLLDALAVLDILAVPAILVPMWAQERHSGEMRCMHYLKAYREMGYTIAKFPTSGNKKVSYTNGKLGIPNGEAGNRDHRLIDEVVVNKRGVNNWDTYRGMPLDPYSENRDKATFDPASFILTTIMETPIDRVVPAILIWLKDVTKNPRRTVAFWKPTQNTIDKVAYVFLQQLCVRQGFSISTTNKPTDYYADPQDHQGVLVKQIVDALFAKTPEGYWDEVSINPQNPIEFLLSDLIYPESLWDTVKQIPAAVYTCDKNGDGVTDLLPAIMPALKWFLTDAIAKGAISTTHGDAAGAMRFLGYNPDQSQFEVLSELHHSNEDVTDETITGSDPKNGNPLLKGEQFDVPHKIEGAFNLIVTSVKRANPTHTDFADYSNYARQIVSGVYKEGVVNFLLATSGIKTRLRRPAWLA
ncbi:MAG: hypothetical protein ACK5O1_04480 [Holosporales bacterium]|jgi:hypothetical protein